MVTLNIEIYSSINTDFYCFEPLSQKQAFVEHQYQTGFILQNMHDSSVWFLDALYNFHYKCMLTEC